MSIAKLPHIWSKESLLNKAQRYATTMLRQDRESWQFGFWSSLTLELLVRAALASISPTLLADGKDWNNIYYALGNQPTDKKFLPKSADIRDILNRLGSIFPDFTHELLTFSIIHINRRNSELHSGELPFDGLSTSQWLPMFYKTSQVLLKTLKADLDLLFGGAESRMAATLIQALGDEAAKAVQGTILAHQKVWEEKSAPERQRLQKQAEAVALRHLGHRVSCPSCGSPAMLHGTPSGAPSKSLEDDVIVMKQTMLPSQFECRACGLKVVGYSKLNACGLGDPFTATSRFDAADYYGSRADDDEPYEEEDFNE